MKVTTILDRSIEEIYLDEIDRYVGSDVIIFSFSGLGLISFKKELENETEYFVDLARLSKELSCVIISGCDTDSYGNFRHSVVIADKGKILGVSDMVHCAVNSEYTPGGGFRVYDTSKGKIGILVGEDLFFPESMRVLTLCDADIIVCVFNQMKNEMPIVLLRAGAFSNGIDSILCAKDYSLIVNSSGNITFAKNGDVLKKEINIEKDYRLIALRQRGVYKHLNSNY